VFLQLQGALSALDFVGELKITDHFNVLIKYYSFYEKPEHEHTAAQYSTLQHHNTCYAGLQEATNKKQPAAYMDASFPLFMHTY
jgi:hypothetical protein